MARLIHIREEMEEALEHKQEAECNMKLIIKIITNRCDNLRMIPTIWFRTGWCRHRSLLVDLGRRADKVELVQIIRLNNHIFKTISQSILILIETISRRMLKSMITLMRGTESWDRVRTFLAGMGKGLIHIKSLKPGSCSLQTEWLQPAEELKLQVVHLEEAMRPLSPREALSTSILSGSLKPIKINTTTSVRIPTRTGTKKMITMKSKM